LRYATAFGTTGNVKSKIILQVIENQYEYTNGAIFIQKGTLQNVEPHLSNAKQILQHDQRKIFSGKL